MADRFYSTRAWRDVRRRALGRDKHRCTAVVRIAGEDIRCAETQKVAVHHIVAIDDGGAPLDLTNLVTLCDHHHAWAHGNVPDLLGLRARQARTRGTRKPKQRPNAGAYVLHGGRE